MDDDTRRTDDLRSHHFQQSDGETVCVTHRSMPGYHHLNGGASMAVSEHAVHAEQRAPLAYILLVNWNAREHTLSCLSSLQAISYPNYRVFVVDNDSSDGSPEAIATAYPDIPLLRLPTNRGFTGANNAGFAHALAAGADFVYLLNTDTRVAPDFLTRAIETASDDASIGVIGSKVLHADRPDTIQFGGGRVNLTTGYNGRPLGYNQVDRGQCDGVSDIAWTTGAAMMMSRSCLEAIDGFDDAFFAFQEDVDLCLRARAAGFRVVMSPTSHVWHQGGGSLQGAASATHMYYDVRNALLLTQKHRPLNALQGLLRTACILGAHGFQVLLIGPSRYAINAIVAGARDYYHGIGGGRPSQRACWKGLYQPNLKLGRSCKPRLD